MTNSSVLIVSSNLQTKHWLIRQDLVASLGARVINAQYLPKMNARELLRQHEVIISYTDLMFDDTERKVLYYLLKELDRPVALIDDRDDSVILRLATYPNVIYFKRELRIGLFNSSMYLGMDYWPSWVHLARRLGPKNLLDKREEAILRLKGKIRPLPLTISNSIPLETSSFHKSDKKYVVSLICNMSVPRTVRDFLASGMSIRERLTVANLLSNIPNHFIHLYNYDKPKLGKKLDLAKYVEVITSSISSVAPKGSGWDTYRYYEIPALGSVLLSKAPRVIIPDNFEDNKEALFFRDYHELIDKVYELASNPKKARMIATAGFIKYQRYHSPIRRFTYLMESLKMSEGEIPHPSVVGESEQKVYI